jgi:hypothetical protein
MVCADQGRSTHQPINWRIVGKRARQSLPCAKKIPHRAIWVEPSLLAKIQYRASSAEGKCGIFFQGSAGKRKPARHLNSGDDSHFPAEFQRSCPILFCPFASAQFARYSRSYRLAVCGP